jgi:hypothetical protein
VSYSGGVFSINTTGQPVVAGTTISASVFNALTADLATGLSTCVLKDGTQTITANIPMSSFKLTGLAVGTATTDSVRLSQVGMVLLATASASASAAIDFTSGITSTYDEYMISLTNVVPATDDTTLLLRVSEDAGSTFKAGATDYTYAYNSEQEAGADTSSGSAAASAIRLGVSMSSTASAGGWCGEVRFFAPAGTTQNKLFTFSGGWPRTSLTDFRCINGAGRFVLDTNAINGIRFLAGSGNLTSGNFALYGIKKT